MKDIKEFLSVNKKRMLEILGEWISFPSMEGEKVGDYPFGKPVGECLDSALAACTEFGFKTKNLDYYAGFGEIGQGDKTIGIMGHLDVVPVGPGWDSNPFVMTIKNDKIYGRGASDDKGPMVAALFALKYLQENKDDIDKKIRIVFGCNEESGMKCAQYYVEKEGHFDWGFSPDGPFPCCFGEKGIINFRISAANNIFKSLKGGVARNVVPDTCTLSLPVELVDQDKLKDYLDKSPLLGYKLAVDDDVLSLETNGRAAHASTPEEGINAISYALCALKEAGVIDPALDEFYKKINTEYTGKSCGIDLKDKYGDLTFNVGIIELVGDDIVLNVDIRCPFTYDNKVVIDKLSTLFEVFAFEVMHDSKGLYQPEDSEFVQLLTSTYNEVAGRDEKPLSMGGGTYAREINNTLAFGPNDDKGEDTHIHDANEFIKEETLLNSCEIYIKTLLKILKL